jgi:hypothetical protein
MWAKRLEELEHLLVGASIPTGEVVNDNVFEVEVTNSDLVGVSVRHLEGLGHAPRPDTVDGVQDLPGAGWVD